MRRMLLLVVMLLVAGAGSLAPRVVVRAQNDCSDQPTPRLNINMVAVVVGDAPVVLLPAPDFPRAFDELWPGTMVRVIDKPICHDGRYLVQVAGVGTNGWGPVLAADGTTLLEPLPDADLPSDVLFVGQTLIETPDLIMAHMPEALGERVLVQHHRGDQLLVTYLDYPNRRVGQQDQIVIFPTDHYTGPFPDVAAERLPQLLSLFSDQPDLLTTTADLPILPAFGFSSQEFVARAGYINGTAFTGFSFVTRYTQNLVPLVGDDLRFVVQGVFDDGALYVYALTQLQTVAPLALPDFEETIGVKDIDEMMEPYTDYLLMGAGLIDGLPDEAFVPPAQLLGEVVGTMELRRTRADFVFPTDENFRCGTAGAAVPLRYSTATLRQAEAWDNPTDVVPGTTFDMSLPVTLIEPVCLSGFSTWWRVEQGRQTGYLPMALLSQP